MKRVLISLLFAAAAFCTVFFDRFGAADKTAEDFLYHRPDGTTEKIKIIKIDDKSINALGNYEDWDRSIYADLVNTLCVSEDIKPAVIGFDVLFGSDYGTEADKRFAEACAEHGNTVCAFSYVFERELVTDDDGNLKIDNLAVVDTVKPYPALYSVTKHGFANALMDKDDGFIRSSFLYFPTNPTAEDIIEFSFNAEVYKAYAAAEDFSPVFPNDMERAVFSFRYSGGVGDYENVSLSDVLDGSVPPQAFDDCIVLVGAYTAGMMDAYYVPADRGQQMYGVEIHANVIQSLLDGKYIYDIPKLADALAAAVLAGILAFLCFKLSVARVIAACSASAALRLGAGYLLFMGIFGAGYSASVLAFPIAALCIMIYYTAAHYYSANRAKREIERAFKKYVAPQVVNEIAKSGKYELKLGGENRDIAVLFVDIRGFTPLSESLEPEQVVDILNSYLELTTSCIFRYGGTLDKFVGDATMAVFNAPFDAEDYVFKAVMTAWDIARGGDAIEKEFAERYGKHVGFGVGVNCGPAVVGNIGCEFRMDYTAIGDTVNTAARLEANAPRGKVYISDAVYERVGDRITVEEIGEIPLKGKSKGVFVYSVTGINSNAEENKNESLSAETESYGYETVLDNTEQG